jgi:hypothetical protein
VIGPHSPLEEVPTERLVEELRRRGRAETSEEGALLDMGYGEPVDLLDPDPGHLAFSIEEIAGRLSREYRYSNSCRYTVAQHSVIVSRLCEENYKLSGLLHDAPEAFIRDVPRPVKEVSPGYRAVESALQSAIEKRYRADLSATPVREADLKAYVTERESDPIPGEGIGLIEESEPAEVILPIHILPEGAAKNVFLEQYNRLNG